MPKRTTINAIAKKSKTKPVPNKRKAVKVQNICQILESPVKSPNDKKIYRTIKLSNDLTALLICDESAQSTTCESESSDSESYSSEDGTNSCSAESDISDNSPEFSKPCPSKTSSKLAAAALTISVGSFSDPSDIQGLAHFLEHMVFMGSKAFPCENDFDSFVKKKGGSDNAQTGMEFTTFYFEVRESSFEEALFKFAQFFIEPLLKEEAMTRERKAVESEFKMALQNDDNRVEQLLLSFAREGHPARTFSWGNFITLEQNVQDNVLYERLHAFRKRHYSGNRMTLAVQSRKSLEVLQEIVVRTFSNVPNNKLMPLDFRPLANESAFDTHEFKKMHYVKPVKDTFQVNLTWSMPSLLQLYHFKPHAYVSWILGYEGAGSLLAYLRNKFWAISIDTGNSEADSEHNSIYCLFAINIVLTEDGMKNLDKVLHAVFAYLALIKEKGVSEKIFNDIKLLEDIDFRFIDEQQAVENVEEISVNMHYFSPTDYLTGPELLFKYNPEYINEVLDNLNSKSVNIIVLDSTLGDVYNKEEQWFSTKYFSKDIPIDWVSSWECVSPYADFELPDVTEFLTTDFSLVQIPKDASAVPVNVFSNELAQIWHKFDTVFKIPKAHIYLYFETPVIQYSAKHASLLDLFILILNHRLVELLYPATAAHLNYRIYGATKGFIVKVDGFNERLPVVLRIIFQMMNTIASKVTTDFFQMLKDQQLKNYHNYFIKPSRLIKDLKTATLLQRYWTQLDKFAALKEVCFDDLQDFSKELFESLYVKVLAEGNIRDVDAKDTALNGIDLLNFKHISPDNKPVLRVMKLPVGEKTVCCLSLNEDDTNSVIINYYQAEPLSLTNYAILELLMAIMEEPVFDVLRTKEQLGYDIRCDISNCYGVLGFSISVYYQADKFESQYINNRIEAFLLDFKKTLFNLSEADFNDFKQSLIQVKQCPDVDLSQGVSRNWSEIVAEDYLFDRLSKEVDFLKRTSLDSVIKWFNDHITGGSQFRKMSFQVLGYKLKGDKNLAFPKGDPVIMLDQQDCTAYKTHLDSYLVSPDSSNIDFYITSLQNFKKELYLYPVIQTDVQ